MADRTLKLVTKTIQNLANLVEFKRKEALMVYLNPFINEYMQRMKLFVNDVSVSLRWSVLQLVCLFVTCGISPLCSNVCLSVWDQPPSFNVTVLFVCVLDVGPAPCLSVC